VAIIRTRAFFFGVPMSFRRVGWLAAIALATWLELSCGQVYRPVVIPVSITPPNPANFHAVFGISANVPFNPGTALQIDVSGDSNIGVANMGVNPTHAAILPNNSRVFVASAGSLFTGDADVVTAFFPAVNSSSATGLSTTTTFSLPYGSQPVFVNTTQTNAVYVANYGTNSVSALNSLTNTVGQTRTVGVNPVALAETPNSQNLYVVNQGDNTVIDLSPTDLSLLATITVGNTPVWAVSRPDNQRVYVVTQGDGQLYTIDAAANTILSIQSVGGAGANFVFYDKSRNRLYVTNPNAGAVYVFDATTDPPTPMGSTTGAISILTPPIPANTPPCIASPCSYSPVVPVSVAALPDGSRFYVASYVTAASGSSCPDPNVAAAGCVIPQVTVFDAGSLIVKTTVFPLLPPVTNPVSKVQPFALAPVTFCASVFPYTPASARFRMSAVAATDSSRVYASMCDGGSVAIVTTKTNTIATGVNAADTLVTDLPAPFSGGPPQSNNEPPPQSPVFLLTGQ
jgi:DNA-binding beta-propeller fold protein YncE